MAIRQMISVEEYLRTAWPDGDREYVDGEVLERPMPPFSHGEIQMLLGAIFLGWSKRAGAPRFIPVSEVRHRVAETRFRLPDVAVFVGGRPAEEVPEQPPLVTIEILSPDDRMSAILEKLREYRDWGVPHVWVVEPMTSKLYEFTSDGLREVESLRLPEYSLEITPADLFRAA